MYHQVLIADSGSTKTDWALVSPTGGVQHMATQGINPFHQDEAFIRQIITNELRTQIADADEVCRIRFYGSGVRPELQMGMERLLHDAFPSATDVQARGDLLGAARALCGHEEGIACILGTGANSCLYDGENIVANTPPLGYILGDEGSGAVLGRLFVNALYKGKLSQALLTDFEQWSGMSMADVISRVYRQPMANRWLASLSVFIHGKLSKPEVEMLVINNFRDFIQKNIQPYGRQDLPLNFVGSIASFYHEQLAKAVMAEKRQLGRVMRSPLEGLIQMEQLGQRDGDR